MEFFIKKGATLPLLKLNIVDNGRNDYNNFLNTLELSSLFFSMTNVDTGIPKIMNKPAGIGGDYPNYFIYYQFQNTDTKKEGRFEGEFILKNLNGTSILTLGEKIYINVTESFIIDDLEYSTCYSVDYTCCNNLLPVPLPSFTPTSSVTPSITPTVTPTPSVTDSSLVLGLEQIINPGSVEITYVLTSSRLFNQQFTMSFTNVLGVITGDSIYVSTGVTIDIGQYSASTQVITSDNFDNLDRSSQLYSVTTNLTGVTYSVYFYSSKIFATPTPTPTPTMTITPTITFI